MPESGKHDGSIAATLNQLRQTAGLERLKRKFILAEYPYRRAGDRLSLGRLLLSSRALIKPHCTIGV